METIDIRALCLRMLKNWYWFVISFVLCLSIGVLYYFSTTPSFKVSAALMLRTNDKELAFPQAEMLELMGMSGNKQIDDEMAILTSRDILIKTIQNLDLQSEYRVKKGLRWVAQYPTHELDVLYPEQFTDTMRQTTKIFIKVRKHDYVVRVKYGRWIRSRAKIKSLDEPIPSCVGELHITAQGPLEPGTKYRVKTTPLLPLAASYAQRIEAAKKHKESNVIVLSSSSDVPQRVVDFMNKQIELYNLDAVIDKNMIATNTAQFINDRLVLIEQELVTAEQDVQQYKQEHHIVSPTAEAGLYFEENSTYRSQLAQYKMQLELLKYVEECLNQRSSEQLIPSNLGLMDEGLTTMIMEYNQLLISRLRVLRTAKEDNPVVAQIDTQLAAMRSSILQSVQSARNSVNISIQNIEKMQASTRGQLDQTPALEREYVAMKRNQSLKESLYLYLYQKREENALTLASTVMPAKLIDIPKIEPRPVAPRLKIIALMILFFTLVLPLVSFYIYDLFNDKVENEADYEKRVSIPYAGAIVKNHHGGHIAVQDGVKSVSAELFRSLRTNIKFLLPAEAKHPVILVTSAINGEGKSYIASNLALSLALIQKKVVLVGLDIRKPQLAHYFQLPKPGALTEYLAEGTPAIEELIQPSGKHANLDIIPAGVVPPNPNELVLSERLDELFKQLKTQYDYIIIDTAPVALVSDTFMLDRLSDMTLFVSREKYTTHEMLAFITKTQQQNRLKNMVGVLNAVRSAKVGYGY